MTSPEASLTPTMLEISRARFNMVSSPTLRPLRTGMSYTRTGRLVAAATAAKCAAMPALRRAVVVGGDRQYPCCADVGGRPRELDRVSSVVGARTCDHRDRDGTCHGSPEVDPLGVAQRGPLACRAGDDEPVAPVPGEMVGERDRAVEVDPAGGIERGRHRGHYLPEPPSSPRRRHGTCALITDRKLAGAGLSRRVGSGRRRTPRGRLGSRSHSMAISPSASWNIAISSSVSAAFSNPIAPSSVNLARSQPSPASSSPSFFRFGTIFEKSIT